MKFSEAMSLLNAGKKVRDKVWGRNEYIYKKEDGSIWSENECEVADLGVDGEWEEYIEPQEPIEETEESNYGIQDRLSMILENQTEMKAGIKTILKWLAVETKER